MMKMEDLDEHRLYGLDELYEIQKSNFSRLLSAYSRFGVDPRILHNSWKEAWSQYWADKKMPDIGEFNSRDLAPVITYQYMYCRGILIEEILNRKD